jgi:3-methyladenine DNA glycosylase AlkD
MTAPQIMKELKSLGTEAYKRILCNHGAKEPVFGVKIEELKKYQKRIKKDYQLALDLYATGNYDAQYLAGLIADETKMTKKDLKNWLAKANCDALYGSTVPWIAAESNHGWELAMEWIDSKKESVATAGWTTLCSLVSIRDDADLDLAELKRLLQRVETSIQGAPNHVRYAMNSFVIGVGCYVKELTDTAMKTAKTIGKVTVDMGNTACKVPFAPDYIKKVQQRGTIGKKRAMARC